MLSPIPAVSIFLDKILNRRANTRFSLEIPYQYLVRIEEKPDSGPP